VLPAVNLASTSTTTSVAPALGQSQHQPPQPLGPARGRQRQLAPFGGTISAGNPNLRPFLADVEASLEVYQGRAGYFAVSLFYKRMDSFITSRRQQRALRLDRLSAAVPQSRQTGPTRSTTFVRPVNGDGASIKGVELALQRDFDFLPAPFDKLGFVGNVTYAHGRSNVMIDGKPVSLDLFQLSKWTSNATLYYETARWGARVSSAPIARLSGRRRRQRLDRLGLQRQQQHRRRRPLQRRARIEAGGRGSEPHRPGDRPVHRLGRRPPAGAHPQRPNRHPGRRL
jgi:iron complex outermembrane receptor protein